MSQVLTTPFSSTVIATPYFACKLMDMIAVELSYVDSRSTATGSAGKVSICQNLIDPLLDDMRREEDNVREVMSLVCPMKGLVRNEPKLVMTQT